MRPRHVLYFIQFLLLSIAFCVSEELVVLITHCPLSAFIRKRLWRVSDVGAWNKKRRGGKELYDNWCVNSQMLIILLWKQPL